MKTKLLIIIGISCATILILFFLNYSIDYWEHERAWVFCEHILFSGEKGCKSFLIVGHDTVGEKKDLIDDDKTIIDKYKDLPEVIAFYAEYENAQVSVRKDHISYFVGSQDDYLLRMNLEFDENYEIENKEFHCYYKKTPQWEMSQESIVSNLAIYDCGKLKSFPGVDEKLDLQ